METLLQDIRFAARSLLRNRGFTLVAVLTLALGIGATTAVFSVVNGIILKPLPYPDADRVVYLGWDFGEGNRIGAVTPLKFAYWRDHTQVFDGVATYRSLSADLSVTPDYDGVQGLRVSKDFFDVIGTQPALGRAFAPEENEPGGPTIAVVSHAFWQNRLLSDPAAIGRTLRLDGEPFTVIGVMPPDFQFVGASDSYDLLVPLQLEADPNEGGHNYNVIARLAPGVTRDQAEADLARVLPAFRTTYPDLADPGEAGVYLTTYQDLFVAELQTRLWILLGATILVLLIACADVANLLLARATGRRREIALRAALGASRGRIVRELLTESFLLSAMAGAAGLLIGLWSVHALVAAAPWSIPRADAIGLDGRVLGFALLAAVGTAVVFGLTSAVAATRLDLVGVLKEGGRGSDGGARRRARNTLVMAETAVSMVLLIGAGLLIASFVELLRVDPGLDPENVLTAEFERAPEGYNKTAQVWQFEKQALERIRAIPGVADAAGVSVLPFTGQYNTAITVAGRPEATEGAIQIRAISPGYFGTLEIPLLRGRGFSEADAAGAPPVAIISEATAKRYWPNGDAIGQRILVGVYEGRVREGTLPEPHVVVGLVASTRDISLSREHWRTIFLPQAQVSDGLASLPGFVVRTQDSSPAIRDAITRAIVETDPRMPAPEFRPLDQMVSDSVENERFLMLLMALFAGLALVLTAIGIYGVVSYTVGQRTREIGVRMALGAHRGDVLRLVVRQGMSPVLIGLGLGLAAAFGLTHVLAGMLYGVGPRDPVTFLAVALVLAGVALFAIYAPARRATRVDPMVTLRTE